MPSPHSVKCTRFCSASLLPLSRSLAIALPFAFACVLTLPRSHSHSQMAKLSVCAPSQRIHLRARRGKPGSPALWRPSLSTLNSATPKASTKNTKLYMYPLYRGTSLMRNRPPPGAPKEPRHSLAVRSYREAVSYKRGNPASTLFLRFSGCRCSFRDDSNAKPNLKHDAIQI